MRANTSGVVEVGEETVNGKVEYPLQVQTGRYGPRVSGVEGWVYHETYVVHGTFTLDFLLVYL